MHSQKPKHSKNILYIFTILSFLGFLDATFLTVKHFSGESIPCSILHGCDVVTTSVYSLIFGIPVALIGAIFYVLLFVMALIHIESGNKFALKYMSYAPVVGFIASLRFLLLQAVVINAYCLYCLISALISTLLFVTSVIMLKSQKNIHEDRESQEGT